MTKTATVLETKPHVEAPKSGLGQAVRKEMSELLGEALSATYSLVVKTHVHHWNVVGPLFQPLHSMLEGQYGELFETTDLYAERIRALGFLAPIPKIFVKQETRGMSAEQIVEDLVADHESRARNLRDTAIRADELEDIVTHDMLVAKLAWHEKTIWMLRACLVAA